MEPVKVAGFSVRKALIIFLKKKYARNARGSQCQKDDIAVTTGAAVPLFPFYQGQLAL